MNIQSRVYCPWHPERLDKPRALIIDDFLELTKQNKIICLKKMISMIDTLNTHGLNTPHIKHLFSAIYELKDRTSDGGARVYFIAGNQGEYYIFHAECKKEQDANETMLADGIDILEAAENGKPIFPRLNTPRKWRERSKS